MTDKYIVKTNVEGLVKDKRSGAILNVDNKALEAYRKQKAAMNRTIETAVRLDKVENEMGEIKGLLQKILDKLT